MDHELKEVFVKLGALLAITPILGFALLRFVEYLEKVWKTGSTSNAVNLSISIPAA